MRREDQRSDIEERSEPVCLLICHKYCFLLSFMSPCREPGYSSLKGLACLECLKTAAHEEVGGGGWRVRGTEI